jgi:hypothetical protein
VARGRADRAAAALIAFGASLFVAPALYVCFGVRSGLPPRGLLVEGVRGGAYLAATALCVLHAVQARHRAQMRLLADALTAFTATNLYLTSTPAAVA